MGSLAEWIATFRELHEKSRRGALGQGEASAYRTGRDELARALLAAQRLTLKPGETPRQALRVARALQVDLDFTSAKERSVTVDLSTGGFSTLLTASPPLGDEVGITLRLPAAEPLACRALITDVRPQGGHIRVAARFVSLPAADRERLERYILDTVLAQLTG